MTIVKQSQMWFQKDKISGTKEILLLSATSNRQKKALPASEMVLGCSSICVCPRVSKRLPLDVFMQNLVSGTLIKKTVENPKFG